MRMRKLLSGLILLLMFACFAGCAEDEKAVNITSDTSLVTISETSDENHQDDATSMESETESEPEPEPAPEPEPEPEPDPVELILQKMSLEQKVYQMFVCSPEQLMGYREKTSTDEALLDTLKKWPVGGIIYFYSNFENPTQTVEMISTAQEYSYEASGLPLFTCVDEEGGRVSRIGRQEAFGLKWVGPMASIKTDEEAYETGLYIGEYLKDLGLNFNFAPIADVLTNKSNEAIGDRSFSSDPIVVSTRAALLAGGLQENGVIATYKHFPGHGGTEGDTHDGLAYTNKTLDELMADEMIPFMEAEENGIEAIMVAHISVPNVLGDYLPCSLSYDMITGLLRKEFGYSGLIITDAFNMAAITEYGDEACVMAVDAGVDLILIPNNVEAGANAIINAINDGRLSEERIDESLRRIIKAKINIMNN